ncbi:hypothetical protein LMG26858_01938 [Achromobacter anxifer]|uniref:Uncharacterized protein n=1 Tax=Achromobacter anxifer TaxID=1287737 RepID=A0A6S7DJY9_9BURK|nr:hypothetical protein [Achromobacter anxifer]CAB3855441.1 hypothetical protein LMG26858_01938 [Achromobacter anxifer]
MEQITKNNSAMTETEQLLRTAADIAKRTFADPSEAAVLVLFKELCSERERMAWASEDRHGAAVH